MKAIILLLTLVYVSLAFPGQKDEVIILPGLRIQPSFKHYSGYLNGSDTIKLHYWFVESEGNAKSDPLVLWVNGGPGCSSLDGLINEHGPFRAKKGGFLDYNPHSWNKIANIIYLESPACVGFSYSTDGNCIADDDSTSHQNYNALKDFFVKFPQYKNRDFYITGESYGGYYVPTLAERVLLSTEIPYIRMKGIAVGNGLSSLSLNDNGNLHFAYNHGLIGDRQWRDIIATCCHNLDPIHCDITGSTNSDCQNKVQSAQNQLNYINVYNIYAPCVTANGSDNTIWTRLNVSSNYDRFRIMMGWIDDSNTRLVKLRHDYKILKTLEMTWKTGKVRMAIPCVSDSITDNYLNNDRVRYALHIPANLPAWTVCSEDVYNNYVRVYKNMSRQYTNLFRLKDFKILIYNGDVDMACSYLSDEWYFERLNRSISQARKPWMYKDENNTPQVGGFVKIWDKFSLVTVRGAGHMVPTDKPIAAFHLFDSFIKNKNL